MRSFEHTFATIAGEADLQLSNGDVGVSETLIERARGRSRRGERVGIVRGTLATRFGTLTVFGVDLLADQQLRERQFPRRHVHLGDELRFVNADDLDRARRRRLRRRRRRRGLDTPLDATGPTGPTRLVMRGTLDPVGPATLFGGAVGLDRPADRAAPVRARGPRRRDRRAPGRPAATATPRPARLRVARRGGRDARRSRERGSEESPASSAVSARSSPSRACSASPSALSSCITRSGAPCCSAAARSPSPGRSATDAPSSRRRSSPRRDASVSSAVSSGSCSRSARRASRSTS